MTDSTINIRTMLKRALLDRSFLVAFLATILAFMAIGVLSIIEIRPNELQVPIRNTVFGITHTYREQWYNELSFVFFALLVAGMNTLIASKLFAIKDRRYGIAFQWLTCLLLAISFVIFIAIFRVISVVE